MGENLFSFIEDRHNNKERTSEIPSILYTIIMWYQEHYPQSLYGKSEIAAYLLDNMIGKSSDERIEVLQSFSTKSPSKNQMTAATNVLLYFHKKLKIKADIPDFLIERQVFDRPREEAILALMEEINKTPLSLTLRSPFFSRNSPYPYTNNHARVVEFMEEGGVWVDMVKTSLQADAQAFRRASQDEKLLVEYQQGKIWERRNDYLSSDGIPESQKGLSSINAVSALLQLCNEQREVNIYSFISSHALKIEPGELETFLHGNS